MEFVSNDVLVMTGTPVPCTIDSGLTRNAAQVFKDVLAHAHWKLENVSML